MNTMADSAAPEPIPGGTSGSTSSNRLQADLMSDSANAIANAIAGAYADLERRQQQGRELVTLWESLDRATRGAMLLAEYRCTAGNCLLLHIFRLPAGRFYYKPAYDLSPALTESETDPGARRTRTSDGYRRWQARVASLDHLVDFAAGAEFVGEHLDCDHLRKIYVPSHRLDADASGRPGPQAPIFWPT
jgi:hypothetical protein